jgi:aminoglycoside/choline kinase family phosphotransferase
MSSDLLTAAARDWIKEALGRGAPLELQRLTGGASPRRFLRVSLEDGSRAILMEVPPDTPDRALAEARGRIWPFLEVRALLEARGVRVPRLLAEACENGWLLVEDLGETLAERLERHPEQRAQLHRQAAIDLALAQAKLDPLPEGSIVLERAFDRALLEWELEHFWEWGLVARGQGGEDRPGFEAGVRFLLDSIGVLPQGFVHRDYQSRNLMVTGEPERPELAWIDFQDALLGPRAYDLVALLCDSYQPFERTAVEARLDDYAAARGLLPDERRALGHEFDLLTVQRKLKDAGRFVFIQKKRGDPSFLRFVEPTLAIVDQALARLRGVSELRPLAGLVRRALGQ